MGLLIKKDPLTFSLVSEKILTFITQSHSSSCVETQSADTC